MIRRHELARKLLLAGHLRVLLLMLMLLLLLDLMAAHPIERSHWWLLLARVEPLLVRRRMRLHQVLVLLHLRRLAAHGAGQRPLLVELMRLRRLLLLVHRRLLQVAGAHQRARRRHLLVVIRNLLGRNLRLCLIKCCVILLGRLRLVGARGRKSVVERLLALLLLLLRRGHRLSGCKARGARGQHVFL